MGRGRKVTPVMLAESHLLCRTIYDHLSMLHDWHPGSSDLASAKRLLVGFQESLQDKIHEIVPKEETACDARR